MPRSLPVLFLLSELESDKRKTKITEETEMKKIWKKSKKPIMAVLSSVLLVLAVVLLFGQTKAEPENPMDGKNKQASQMYLTSSRLAMDRSLLEGVENANIHAGDSENRTDGQGQQNKPEEVQENQDQPQDRNDSGDPENRDSESGEPTDRRQDSTPQENGQAGEDGAAGTKGLRSLIARKQAEGGTDSSGAGNGTKPGGGNGDQGSGGGTQKPVWGGSENQVSPDEASELFTTSIKNGETVTKPDYFFTVSLTEKGKKLTLVSTTAEVNGAAAPFESGGSVTLREGRNTIVVTLRFRDEKLNQIVAPSKTYTVYYVPESHYLLTVRNVKTGEWLSDGWEETTEDPELVLHVTAQKGQNAKEARVRQNLKTISKQDDGNYHMTLKLGENTIKIMAGSGVNQAVMVLQFYYQPQDSRFSISFESAAVNQTISGDQFGGTTRVAYASDSDAFAFRVSCAGTTGREKITSVLVTNRFGSTEMLYMAGGDGYIHCTLEGSSKGTAIQVTGQDGDGNAKTYTWKIDYQRQSTPEAKKPNVLIRLANETVTNPKTVVGISANDYQLNALNSGNFVVTLNGVELSCSGVTGTDYEYNLFLEQGENELAVTVTDAQQNSVTEYRTITYEPPEAEDTITVTLVVDAENVGAAPMIRETVQVRGDLSVGQLLEQRLAAYGYTTNYKGDPTDGSYYLARILKPGILNGWHISDERRADLFASGFDIREPLDDELGSLGEFDFTKGSGWMISINEDYYIAQGMGSRDYRDGDLIHVAFTLDYGRDLGSMMN